MPRGKHHYTIIRIDYEYLGDYLDYQNMIKTEHIVYQTNKKADADRYYLTHNDEEDGCWYKGCWYPNHIWIFRKDY